MGARQTEAGDTAARLAFEAVTCLRGGRLLFEDVSFALAAGEAAIVAGPNGIGKSSLLRIGAGLLAPAAGRVATAGGIAWMGEAVALDAAQPLGHALGFWSRIDGSDTAAVDEALEAVGLAELADVPVRLLSTGQRRRAAFARVLASAARIWLLDEPGSGLDEAALARLAAAMARHRATGGVLLVATHQQLGLADVRRIVLGGAG